MPSSAVSALRSGGPHQPGDPAAAAVGTFPFQGGVDARGAVGAARVLVNCGDLPGQRGRGFFFPMLSMMDILPGLNP
jgi:hypothetical protein